MASNTQGVLENLTDGYLAEAKQIKGGYFVTDSITNVNNRSVIKGSMCFATDTNKFYRYSGSSWVEIDIINKDISINTLNTTNTSSLPTNNSESIKGTGTINLHKVSKTGSYSDLNNKPTIPSAANNGKITIKAYDNEVGSFTVNQSGNTVINIPHDDAKNIVVNNLPQYKNANVLVTYVTSEDSSGHVTGKYTTMEASTFARPADIDIACRTGTSNGIIGMAAAVGLKQVSSNSSDTVTLTLQPKQAIAMHKYSPGYSGSSVIIDIPDGWSCSTLNGDITGPLMIYSDFTIISGGAGSMAGAMYEYVISSSSGVNDNACLRGSSPANLSLEVIRPNEWYYNIVNAVGFNQLSVTIPSSVTLSRKTITFDVYKHGNLVWCYKDFGTQLMFQDNWDLQLPEDWRPKTTAYGIRITDTAGSSNIGSTFEIQSSGRISTFGQAHHYLRYISMVYQIN